MFELEQKLKKAQEKRAGNFPSSQKYFNLYIAAKEWLTTNIFSNAITKVACDGEGFYTDHGISHFNAIISKAELFLNLLKKVID